VPGATGYIDTNYQGKGEAAVAALDEFDLVAVHVEAPDEAAHLGDAQEKVLALERVDEYVTGPMLEALRRHDAWRMLIAPDHPTPVSTKAHSPIPPPFCYAGTGIEAVEKQPFSERAAEAGGLFIEAGHTLIDRVMSRE
jgi:2,3-bisphosphoglycerate-independent phosphoglycerate mutase